MSNDFQGLILCIRVQFLYKGLSFCMKVSFFVQGSHFSYVGCIFYKGLNFPIWVSFLLCGSHFFFFSLHSSNRGLILLGDVTLGLILCGRVSILNEGLISHVRVCLDVKGSHLKYEVLIFCSWSHFE